MHGHLSFPIESELSGIKIGQEKGGRFFSHDGMQELKMQQGF